MPHPCSSVGRSQRQILRSLLFWLHESANHVQGNWYRTGIEQESIRKCCGTLRVIAQRLNEAALLLNQRVD
jgi:hypothetical protein